LSPGRYRLILSGQRGGRFQKIAEYVVSLSYL